MTFLHFYTSWLVPAFATVAFAFSCWKFLDDRRRASRRIRLRLDGSQLRVINETNGDVQFGSAGYIAEDWEGKRAAFDVPLDKEGAWSGVIKGVEPMGAFPVLACEPGSSVTVDGFQNWTLTRAGRPQRSGPRILKRPHRRAV